jgi:hypothetical protein
MRGYYDDVDESNMAIREDESDETYYMCAPVTCFLRKHLISPLLTTTRMHAHASKPAKCDDNMTMIAKRDGARQPVSVALHWSEEKRPFERENWILHGRLHKILFASNKRYSTVQLLTLWREAATEFCSGPSKSTIVDIVDVAKLVENGKVSFEKPCLPITWNEC